MSFLDSMPFFCLFYVIAILLIILFKLTNNQKIKVLFVNLIFLFLFLSVLEVVCYFLNCEHFESTEYTKFTPNHFYKQNDLLGYLPDREIQVQATDYLKKSILYSSTYTINNDYMRITQSSNKKADKCVLFFGCSYTFGLGLNDNETLPYYFGKKGKYRVYNFGFIGYGPHQMLATLERRNIKQMLHGCMETVVVYTGITDHFRRIAGEKFWEKNDPKYVLSHAGVEYQGHFQDKPSIFRKLIKKSQIYFYLSNKLYYFKEKRQMPGGVARNNDLFIGILNKSRDIAMQKYNIKRFIVLFWFPENGKKIIQDDFNTNKYEYYSVNDVLNLQYIGDSRYFLPDKTHPNKFANEKLAEFLNKILTNN